MTAVILEFPAARARPAGISPVALAIYRDLCWRSAGRDMLIAHSVNDGVRASGALRHRVVQARRELQALGLVTLIEPGNGHGPAIWSLSHRHHAALDPDGAA
jgi:hypothetical protein